jgi:hypothetical protein
MLTKPPGSDYDDYSLRWKAPTRERGGCLTTWLVVSTGVALLSVFLICQTLAVVTGRSGLSLRPGTWLGIIVIGGLFIAHLRCLWGIWAWKRWGVKGIAALSIISPLVEVAFGTATATDFVAPFIQIGILYFLVKDRWDDFE